METVTDPAIRAILAQRLLDHYAQHGRDLPWRRTREPYPVWLSEILLQQTGVKSVLPYYERFLDRFPTIQALAAAPLETVLTCWQGLGYYRRAVHLHAAAQQVVQHHQGRLPDEMASLLKLPGIGPSTAGAILAIAFNQHHAILDGNVKRVLSRLLALDHPPDSTPGKKILWETARLLTPLGHAGTHAQAIMDLGATLCRPRSPDCPHCPWNAWCAAHAKGQPAAYPATMSREVSKPHQYQFNALVVRQDRSLLLVPRPAQGLLGGLWCPPGDDPGPTATPPQAWQVQQWLADRYGLQVHLPQPLETVDHIFTHFRLTVFPFFCPWQAGDPPSDSGHRWVVPGTDQMPPISTLHRKVLRRFFKD
ncbi:MAG: A/G-specific adenine glycosylase [Magnetococcales bacterium]|nr:A/G-specific adenine glycosylase [Magnetococcales bacterium]